MIEVKTGKLVKINPNRIRQLEETRKTILANLFAAETIFSDQFEKFFPFIGTTHWEELHCVGFNPQLSQLEAMVTLPLQDSDYQKCCNTSVLPKVRAILAWNQIPPLDPNYMPPFGNHVDADIQIRPKFSFNCLIQNEFIKFPNPEILESIDFDANLKLKKPNPVPYSKLVEKYRKAKVPDHRIIYDAVGPMFLKNQSFAQASLQPDFTKLKELNIDFNKIIKAISEDKANVSFEEIVCVGLNTATDTLGAVIHLKKSSGYSGSLCQSGSKEYVAFWADCNNNGVYDKYLGTASVDVHDINNIPNNGLFYSVFLPINLTDKLKGCDDPNIIRIRAVLSWAVPPSTTDPDQLNTWGNRLDRLVRLRHIKQRGTGLIDLLYYVGNVPIENIDSSTFLANPSMGILNPANCSQPAKDRPFGGHVSVKGRIYNTGVPGSVYYQVQYSPHGANNWLPVTNKITYRLAHPNPFDPLHPVEVKTENRPDGWFPYQEDPTASPPILEESAFLASWSTGSLEGPYDLRVAYTQDYPGLNPINIKYSDIVTIVLDNTNYLASPTANTSIDFSSTLDIVIDGGDCHSYDQGDTIQGHLRAVDKHFWKWHLDLQPSTHTNGTKASPQCRSYGSLSDNGDGNGVWQLDTSKMDKCGYTLTLRGYDRAIVNSNGAVVHHNGKAVGFSVK